jgi:hypothetical protein
MGAREDRRQARQARAQGRRQAAEGGVGVVADWHCRIGKVTRKGGGATVRVLRAPNDDGSAVSVINHARDSFAALLSAFSDNAAGYAVVMWNRSGATDSAFKIARSSPFGMSVVPAIVHDVLAEGQMANVTRDVLNGKA